jgi:ribonuclease VapC
MIHVMDSSALLALTRGETGCEVVQELIYTKDCVISSVNMAEVGTKLIEYGLPPSELPRIVVQFQIDVIDFNTEQAILSAQLRPQTRAAGLSMGDRACLALTKLMEGIAVTTDQAWQDVRISAGVKVLMVR